MGSTTQTWHVHVYGPSPEHINLTDADSYRSLEDAMASATVLHKVLPRAWEINVITVGGPSIVCVWSRDDDPNFRSDDPPSDDEYPSSGSEYFREDFHADGFGGDGWQSSNSEYLSEPED